jgi:hypothetical protein
VAGFVAAQQTIWRPEKFLRDIGTDQDTRTEWHLVPPPQRPRPNRRPSAAPSWPRRIVAGLILVVAAPFVIAGALLLVCAGPLVGVAVWLADGDDPARVGAGAADGAASAPVAG